MKSYELLFESENIYYIRMTELLIDKYLINLDNPEIQECFLKQQTNISVLLK